MSFIEVSLDMRWHGPDGFDMLPAAWLPYGNQAFGKTLSSFNDQALSSLRRRRHKKPDSHVSRWAKGTPKWADRSAVGQKALAMPT